MNIEDGRSGMTTRGLLILLHPARASKKGKHVDFCHESFLCWGSLRGSRLTNPSAESVQGVRYITEKYKEDGCELGRRGKRSLSAALCFQSFVRDCSCVISGLAIIHWVATSPTSLPTQRRLRAWWGTSIFNRICMTSRYDKSLHITTRERVQVQTKQDEAFSECSAFVSEERQTPQTVAVNASTQEA